MTTSTSSAPPPLTGRDIGAVHRATDALLQRLLADAGLPFAEWTVLFMLAGTGPLARAELVRRQADGLKVPETTVESTLDGMLASGLLADVNAGDPRLGPTVAGKASYQPIRDGVDQITAELYGGLPRADLEATRRTLDEVTRRANALLAG